MLPVLRFVIAKHERENSWKVIAEHLVIALLVEILTHIIADWVSETF